MREIKFRAWDSVNHKIVTSGLAINVDTTGRIIPVSFSQGELAYCRDNDVNKVPNVANEIQIMQYTGLKDKNGVEIYEGDIVDNHYFENHVSRHKVYWADSYGCWSTINLKDPIVDRKQLGYFNEAKDLHRNEYLEVIGNIYENPELLEANQ